MMNAAIKLSELLDMVMDVLNDQFYGEEYYIIAETSDIKNYPERSYCFVTLVEKEGSKILAKADAVIWSKSYHIISDFEFTSGVKFERNILLLLKVTVDYSPVFGLKLQINGIDASFTLGNIELQRRQILNDLVSKYPSLVKEIEGGLVTINKRLVRPVIFKRIAVISAPGSDGLLDFRHELEHNPREYRYVIKEYLCQIQGNNAEEYILQQMRIVKSVKPAYDALVVVRGGGSQLDFGPFDTLDLGVEIAGFPIPVITGIGHERNVSIADMVAHLSLKTPTKAANFLLEHNRKAEEDIEQLASFVLLRSRQRFVNEDVRIGMMEERISTSVRKYFNSHLNKLDRMQLTVHLLNPGNILARGFAMVKKADRILNDSSTIKPGDTLEIVMSDAIIGTTVNQKSTKE